MKLNTVIDNARGLSLKTRERGVVRERRMNSVERENLDYWRRHVTAKPAEAF